MMLGVAGSRGVASSGVVGGVTAPGVGGFYHFYVLYYILPDGPVYYTISRKLSIKLSS